MDNGTSVKITDKTVDHRRAALDQTFANALFSGDINVAEATDFKSDLDKIGIDEANLRKANSGQLGADDIKTLLITVEKLKGKFSRLTYNRTKPWSGVDGLVNDIKQKIAVAGMNNQISSQEVDDLQSKIADVLVAKSNERNTQGFVTTDSALKLEAEIATLSDETTKLLADRSVVSVASVQKREHEVDHTIAVGIDSGKLTAVEAAPIIAQFKSVMATIAKLQSSVTADTGALSAVTNDLVTLTLTIKNAKHDNTQPLVSIDQLKGEVDREIKARSFNGKLTKQEGQAFRDKYNQISQTEKTSRALASGLDALTANSLRNDLTTLLKDTKAVKRTASSP
jgi:hypothetical protein